MLGAGNGSTRVIVGFRGSLVNVLAFHVLLNAQHEPNIRAEAPVGLLALFGRGVGIEVFDGDCHGARVRVSARQGQTGKPTAFGRSGRLPTLDIAPYPSAMDILHFENRARAYADDLPGILRATVIDHGISPEVIDGRLIGWDGKYLTIPVRNQSGRVLFFERWNGAQVGVPIDEPGTVELYGWDILLRMPERVIVAEGIHEALVLESHGLCAVSAAGSGRFFKRREWGPALRAAPQVVLAYRRGERRERRRHLPTRLGVIEKARDALPGAQVLTWPEELGSDAGAFEFFVKLGRSAEDFRSLLAEAS